MATYVNNLRLKEITTGDEDGTWGTSTNTNLELVTDGFSYGTKQMAADANETFTMPDATADATRGFYLKITSAASLTATREVTLGPNTVSKVWLIENSTTGSQIITIKQGSGATVNVASGSKVMIATDGLGAGAAVINANPTEAGAGTVTSVQMAGGSTGLTYSGGPITGSGTITTAGTLAVANGGTALTALGTAGQVLAVNAGATALEYTSDAGGDVTLNGVQTLTNKTLTSPVLGGITTTASGNLIVDPATQIVEVKGNGSSVEGQIQLNCHDNSHGQTLKAQPHSASVTNTMLLPVGASSTLVSLVSTDTLTNKTLAATTLSGQLTGADQTVSAVNLKDYGEVTNAIGSIGGGTQDIDLVAGNSVSGTVDTSTTTFTFSNPTASDELCGFTLTLTNGGSQTVNWPASVDWAAATAPTLTTAGVDVLVFYTIDGGTIWYGFLSGAAMA